MISVMAEYLRAVIVPGQRFHVSTSTRAIMTYLFRESELTSPVAISLSSMINLECDF